MRRVTGRMTESSVRAVIGASRAAYHRVMRKHRYQGPRGRVIRLAHDSTCLRGNPLGDPSARSVDVYLPAGYDHAPARRYPLLVDVVGFTGSGQSHTSWRAFTENVPERLDRLIGEELMPPVIVAFPDCFTSLGGNQYVDSAGVGRYATYLTRELVPFLDDQLRTLASRDHRGIFGKSSGGYGALIHGMRHADVWGAVACHSGDLSFEWCYLPEMPKTVDAIARAGGTVERFVEAFHASVKPTAAQKHALMIVAMAATYDPDPDDPTRIRLPVDLATCELDEAAWARWLRHDPVRLVDAHADALRSLRLLYVDCGARDEWNLHHGARALARRLEAAGVPHVHEEFDDDHKQIDYRMDVSLPRLAAALA